ncbi:MAG TPA: hypothetical protein P5056_01545 [Candidatus Paceibacterota bacterium]|nr:hypothetical protein [Candidatus Paceibacterota bacterium]
MKRYNKGNAGPLVASVIIVLVLLVSSYYALKERPLKPEAPIDSDIKALETQSTSTEMTDIEADLNATNLNDLGLDLETAEAEL